MNNNNICIYREPFPEMNQIKGALQNTKLTKRKLHKSAGVEYTSFEYEYLKLESSTSTSIQIPSTSTRVLFSIFKNNKHLLNFHECLEQFFGCHKSTIDERFLRVINHAKQKFYCTN